jgi:hypothetical protein
MEMSSDNKALLWSSLVFSYYVEQAMPCLEFLVGLHDSHFEKLGLSYKVVPGVYAREPLLCPLTTRCLEKLLL